MNYIEDPYALTVAASFGIGLLAKQWESFPNKFIPTLAAFAGALCLPSLTAWDALHIINGALAGAGATGLHQIAKQFTEAR